MGLRTDIGLIPRRANAVQRGLQKVAAIPSLSPLLARLVTPIDRFLHRLSGGKASATAGLIAFPTVVLTTTGARSGALRTAPLAAIPVGDDLALIGSNAGSGKIPGWVFNLRANPQAIVTYNGRVVAVTAREANGDEYEEAFAAAIRMYSGFAGYRERVDYAIPVFMLSNAAGPTQQRKDVE